MDKIRALTLFGFGSLVLALGIAVITGSAKGYEISIYDAYPLVFWLLIIVSLCFAIISIVYQTFTAINSKTLITFEFLLIICTNVLVLLLPIFRGYATFAGGQDPMEHIGFIKDIMSSGHITPPNIIGEDFYHATHVIGATLSSVTGLAPETIIILLPPLFVVFYTLSIYLLARQMVSNYNQVLLITCFGSVLLFLHESQEFAPSVLTFFLLPFTLMLYFKSVNSQSKTFYGIFLLTLLITPIFHPADGTLFLAIIFLFIGIVSFKFTRFKSLNKMQITPFRSNPFLVTAILLSAWFIWFFSFSAFRNNIISIFVWIVSQTGAQSNLSIYGDLITRANVSYFTLFELLIKTYGQIIIYLLVCLPIAIYLLRQKLTNTKSSFYLCIFSLLFMVFFILIFVFFAGYFFIGYGRELKYPLFIATILDGLFFFKIGVAPSQRLKKIGGTKAVMFFVMIVLLSSSIIGLFNVYYSPITLEFNEQITSMDLKGTYWTFSHSDIGLNVNTIFFRAKYAAETVFGMSAGLKYVARESFPPNHFGYDKSNSYGNNINGTVYYIEVKLSKIIYPQLYSEYQSAWRFNEQDFTQIYGDNSVNSVYSNGEFTLYLVRGPPI